MAYWPYIYRKHHSTIHQLIYLEDAVHNCFIEGKHMVSVFFNLEKAFDKTWRYNIMKQYMIGGFKLICPNLSLAFSGTGWAITGYNHQCMFTRRATFCMLEIAWHYSTHVHVFNRSRKLCHTTELKLLFRSVLEEYIEDHTIVCTDVSRMERRLGNVFVVECTSHSWILPTAASIGTAKLYAVW